MCVCVFARQICKLYCSLTKLKVSVGGADVVEGTHEALDDQSNAHGIVDTKVLGHSMRLNERVINQIQKTRLTHVDFICSFLSAFVVLSISKKHNSKKEEAQDHIAHIAPDVVEGAQYTHWVCTLEVVVALVLVATRVQKL